MPTRTFMNLPKDKRIRILKAAKKEFSRVPVEKAVIANIVADARIPRGSFYQYFENIEDLFVYLMNYLYGIDKKKFARYLETTDNDVYEALKIRFAKLIEKLSVEENRQFRLNVLASLANKDSKIYTISKDIKPTEEVTMEYFSKEILDDENSMNYIKIISMVGESCAEKILLDTNNSETIREDYNKCIDFIKMKLAK